MLLVVNIQFDKKGYKVTEIGVGNVIRKHREGGLTTTRTDTLNETDYYSTTFTIILLRLGVGAFIETEVDRNTW